MSRLILFTVLAVTALSSCSVYRYGDKTNTPDDVYYSPTRPGGGTAATYVENDRRNGDGYYRNDDSYSYDDRWLRMRVRDRYRWNAFDDYDWNYSSMMYNPYYSYSYNPYYFNSYWNSYYAWNYNYNPYIGKVILVNPSVNAPIYGKVRNINVGSYSNRGYNNANRPIGAKYSPNNYNNSNTRSTSTSLGSSLKKVFSNGNNGNNGSYYTPSSSGDRPTRTYTPPANTSSSSSSRGSSSGPSSSGSSSSSGGSSGGGGGVSRPSRGN